MIGLDRASVWAVTNTESDMVVASILRDFKLSNSEKFKRGDEIIRVDHKWINHFRVVDKQIKSRIMIDFNYPRYYRDDNIEPVKKNTEKKEVEEAICTVLSQITDEEFTRPDLEYGNIELCMQIYVGSFYKMHNILIFIYRLLHKNFEPIDQKKCFYGDYSSMLDRFYSTGFAFKLLKGMNLKVYSKLHEHNKKTLDKEVGGKLRGEWDLTKGGLRSLYSTAKPHELTLEYLSSELQDFNGLKLFDALSKEMHNNLEYLERKLKGFNPRELKSLVKDYQEWALDDRVMNLAVTNVSNVSNCQTERYRKTIRKALMESQQRSSPMRDNFNNLERLEEFCREILLLEIEIRLKYTQGLSLILKKSHH